MNTSSVGTRCSGWGRLEFSLYGGKRRNSRRLLVLRCSSDRIRRCTVRSREGIAVVRRARGSLHEAAAAEEEDGQSHGDVLLSHRSTSSWEQKKNNSNKKSKNNISNNESKNTIIKNNNKRNSLGLIQKNQHHGHMTDIPLTSPARLASDILIGMNVIVFVLQLLFPDAVSGGGVKVNALIDQGEYYRLLTAAFLHGSPSHLLLNMLSLHSLGSICEWTCGKERFLAIYLLSAIMGNVASYYGTPDGASLGASGAVFGLAGALIVYFTRNKIIFRDTEVPKSLVLRLVATVGCNFLIGSLLPNIDEYGHLGGLVTGMIVCGMLGPAYELCRIKDTPGIWLIDNPPLALVGVDETPHLVYYDGNEDNSTTAVQ